MLADIKCMKIHFGVLASKTLESAVMPKTAVIN